MIKINSMSNFYNEKLTHLNINNTNLTNLTNNNNVSNMNTNMNININNMNMNDNSNNMNMNVKNIKNSTSSKNYDIFETEVLGHGAYSIVYKGCEKSTNTHVAIKKINSQITNYDNIKKEVELIVPLKHENILYLIDFIEEYNSYYFIYEFCENGNLIEFIRNNKNVPNKLNFYDSTEYKYLIDITDGLLYLHNNHIIHRDLKPHNILLKNGRALIGDFGFARKDYDMCSTICGSPLYMAPEILLMKSYNLSCDIWSLGVIFYELICKKHPYNIPTKIKLIEFFNKQNLVINYSILNDVNHFICNIVKSSLLYNVNRRPSVAEIKKTIGLLKLQKEGDLVGSFNLIDDNSFDNGDAVDFIEDCNYGLHNSNSNCHDPDPTFYNLKAPASSPINFNKNNNDIDNDNEFPQVRKRADSSVNMNYIDNVISSSPKITQTYLFGTSPSQESDLVSSINKSISKSYNTIIGMFKKSASY